MDDHKDVLLHCQPDILRLLLKPDLFRGLTEDGLTRLLA